MKKIPKRRLIPLVTDLLEYREAANNTIAYAARMAAKYGDVCEVSFTGVKNYFIHDPEVIKEILTLQGPKMKRTYFFKAFRKFLGNGLFTAEGDLHKQQRKLIKPAFYPQMIESYGKIMVATANEEVDNWKPGEYVNINQAMTRITLKVITRTMFASSLDDNVIDEVGAKLRDAFTVMNRILANPAYVYCLINEIKIPIVNQFFKLKKALDKIIFDIIASYRTPLQERKMDLLTMLMEARDEETGSGMSDEQIRDEVMTFFLAGHETTTLALTWSIYLLCRHPQVSARFYHEVANVVGNRLPEAADYSKLLHTKNIFKEALRLYPPAWTFARAPIEDIEIQGYFFPQDSVLWTVTYLLHHNPKYFPDPEAFIPDRWNDPNIKDLPKYAYFPFGGGNRMCIGEGFAWMEGVLVLATIASRYHLEPLPGFTTDIAPLFTLKTKEDVLMKVVEK